jgi:hypothetical protein
MQRLALRTVPPRIENNHLSSDRNLRAVANQLFRVQRDRISAQNYLDQMFGIIDSLMDIRHRSLRPTSEAEIS